MQTALVLRVVGNVCRVAYSSTGQVAEALVKGNLRLKGARSTSPVAVGDIVEVEEAETGSTPMIAGIRPRRNYIIRKATNLSKESHILAANVDGALLVVTMAKPLTTNTFIDRFLATAEAYNVPVTLLFNKADLWPELGLTQIAEENEHLYRSIGYSVLRTSSVSGEGKEAVQKLIAGKVMLVAGHSGVGKSSLINMLLPEAQLPTGAVSEHHGTGTHTTTTSEMIPSFDGGYLIDSPGIKGFGTLEMDERDTAHYFREFFALSSQCRFSNCRHLNEPGCAVRAALAEGRVAESRYISYLSILGDKYAGKYRPPQ